MKLLILIKNRDTKSIRNSEIHIKWANLCEELGLIDDMIMELNLALRDEPGRIDILKRLAEIYHDNGNLDKASRCWEEIIKLDELNQDSYKSLGIIYEEMKE